MSIINSHQPYPGTEADCTKTSDLQHLLDHFQTVEVYSNYSLILFNFEFFYRKQLTMLNNILIQNPFIVNLWKAFDTFTIHSPTSNHLIEYNLMYFYWHENEKFKEKITRERKREIKTLSILPMKMLREKGECNFFLFYYYYYYSKLSLV
jgi:hypothetical protein